LIQVGSHEILLSDALRLATRAAKDDVPVTLEVNFRLCRVCSRASPRCSTRAMAALAAQPSFMKEEFVAA